jgi:hypothetical protein
MNGGEISGNTASTGGGVDVHLLGFFTMSGGARISGDNPVILYVSSIAIGGDFTGPGGPVATIDLLGWSASDLIGEAVLKLGTGYSSGDLSVLRSRFTLGNFVNWSSREATPLTGYAIDTDGTLKAAP